MTTTSPPAAIIDALNGLLEAELNSIFRFMGEGYPFLNRATVEVRKPLREMVRSNERRAAEIADQIFTLGGEPVPRAVEPEEQYLAFLSLKFLLPKLVNSKKLMIQRYENALNVVSPSDGPATELLRRLLDEHRSELQSLEHAATHV